MPIDAIEIKHAGDQIWLERRAGAGDPLDTDVRRLPQPTSDGFSFVLIPREVPVGARVGVPLGRHPRLGAFLQDQDLADWTGDVRPRPSEAVQLEAALAVQRAPESLRAVLFSLLERRGIHVAGVSDAA